MVVVGEAVVVVGAAVVVVGAVVVVVGAAVVVVVVVGQAASSQSIKTYVRPEHSRPPLAGAGAVQVLCLFIN